MWTRAIILICVTLMLGALTFTFLDHAVVLVLCWIAGTLACVAYGIWALRLFRRAAITMIVFGCVQFLAMLIIPQFLKL